MTSGSFTHTLPVTPASSIDYKDISFIHLLDVCKYLPPVGRSRQYMCIPASASRSSGHHSQFLE